MNDKHVTGLMFTFANLREKAGNEIKRLELAQRQFDSKSAMDHAINAVFSIYCLLDWKEKTYKPDSKRRAYELCVESNNSALMMLHDIVSFTKHARVSSSLASTKIEVDSQNQDEQQIVTPDGRLIVTPDGVRIVVPACVLVKFGDMEAVTVLKHALSEFE